MSDRTTVEHSRVPPRPEEEAFAAILCGGARALVPLPPHRELSVGRSRSSHIVIDDPAASRLQATLRWDGKGLFRLEDRLSRNGTFVNGERVVGTISLSPGSMIRVGAARIVLLRPDLETRAEPDPHGMISVDPAMERVVAQARRAAAKDLSLLLRGETGVGKEILARLVHRESPRAGGPFVAINCAAINEGVAESTLFGHEKGAFTGALSRQLGVFESARGGTLLLDEIGELSERMQARLLRVLEEREITRVGGAEAIEVDVRLLAATHRDLHREVEAGRFRQDLLYRVAVLTLEIPPLRDRPADIPFLAERMLADLCPGATLSEDAVAELMRRPFRGNVRELRNLLEGAAALCEGTQITARDLPGPPPRGIESCAGATLETKLEDVERASIAQALEACGGNQSAAAKRLGITRRALIYRMEKHGLKPKPSSERCPEPDQG